MSTFGISQNFRATSVVGRFGRTVEPEKVVENVKEENIKEEDVDEDVEDDVDDVDDDVDEDDEEHENSSKKSKKVSPPKNNVPLEPKKIEERVSCATQFASFINRYAEKTADYH